MGYKKALNDFEKGQILAYSEEGKSLREISRIIHRSVSVVSQYLKNPSEYGKIKSPGRPQKLTLRDKRLIIKKASNSPVSCNQLKKELSLNVSRWTINRAISSSPKLIKCRYKSAPALKPKHKKDRLEFARKCMATNWTKVYNFLLFARILIFYYIHCRLYLVMRKNLIWMAQMGLITIGEILVKMSSQRTKETLVVER